MQNTIKHSNNIELTNTNTLFNKGAILSYLKEHKIDLTSYVFAAIVGGSVMMKPTSEQLQSIHSDIQHTIQNQSLQVNDIIEQKSASISDEFQTIDQQILEKNDDIESETPLELSINFQYDSSIANAGEWDYDKNSWIGHIRLNPQVISKISAEKLTDKDLYAENLYHNELWSIKFMRKYSHKDLIQNHPDLLQKYDYYQIAEMLGEYGSLGNLQGKWTNEANHLFLLRIKEIIHSTWSKNQYAMVSDVFKSSFESVFMWSNDDISYTNTGIDQLLNQNYYGELPYSQISEFLYHIKDNLSSQWIYVDDILEQWNISTKIASNSDYTNY